MTLIIELVALSQVLHVLDGDAVRTRSLRLRVHVADPAVTEPI